MTKEKINDYKIKLDTELKELTEDLESIATLNTTTNDWGAVPIASYLKTADENVEADGVEEWNERRATVSQLETRYRNIILALNKIAENRYGICEISGLEIEERRLDANPAARTNLENIDKEKELTI